MGPESPAKTIFSEALSLEAGAARAAFLARACEGNQLLREEIESLIAAWEGAGDFLDQPAIASLGALSSDFCFDKPGTIIDRYRLLEQIGEGGMGVVYMADQQTPVRRRVALKIIKPGMDTRQVIARFEAERQALAMMDHPNIARVLDAGVTDTGRPYFVMELVRGIPITEYADQNDLTIAARLQLFALVCHAVQHAHQNGIIHRDIKPSNVLVTMHDGMGVPKVIDFGVAKATTGPLIEKTLFTNFNHLIGTPAYMSPEQAEMSGLDVDTRSDIYSLGVLLYELLTGATPFDKGRSREASFDEIRRIIRDYEPPAPSAYVSTLGQATTTLATRRSIDVYGLTRLLRGDLDWIVIKALNKERERRYPTANALAADIERYLRDEPVEARPPSGVYRIRKFARRNRAAFLTVALVMSALVIGSIVSVWQAVRARQAEASAEAQRNDAERQGRRAEENFQKARQAIDGYVVSIRDHKLLSEANYQPLRKELLASTLTYYRQFVEQYRDDPTLQPELGLAYISIGQITTDVGTREQACDLIRQGVEVYQRLRRFDPENQEYQQVLGKALNILASLERDRGRAAESAQASAQAIAIFERLYRAHPDDTAIASGLLHAEFNRFLEFRAKGAWANAEASLRRDLALSENLCRREPEINDHRADLARGLYHLGLLERETERLNQAVDSFQRAGQMFEDLGLDSGGLPVHRRAAANAELNLGDACHILGRNEEAKLAYLSARLAFQDLADLSPPDASGRTGVGRANFRIAMLEAEDGDGQAAAKSLSRAEADFEAAVRQPTPPISALAGLTAALAMEGKWTSAAAAGAKVVDASGRSRESLVELALLQLAAGDESGYRISCSELLSRSDGRHNGHDATDVILACATGETANADTGLLLTMAEKAVAAAPDDPSRRALLGVALWRAGRDQHGLEIVEQSLPLCAAAEAEASAAQDRIRAIHLMAATILARGLAQAGQHEALPPRLTMVGDLVARYEQARPHYDEATPRWLLGVALELARREMAALSTSSAADSAAAQ